MTNRSKTYVSAIVAVVALFLLLKFVFELLDPNLHTFWHLVKIAVCFIVFFAGLIATIIYNTKVKINKNPLDNESNILAREQHEAWQQSKSKGEK